MGCDLVMDGSESIYRYYCKNKKCNFSWWPRNLDKPMRCPRCVSFDIKKGSKKLNRLSCKRCDESWFPRSEKLPRICPKCQNPYWNKERKREKKQTRPIKKGETNLNSKKTK